MKRLLNSYLPILFLSLIVMASPLRAIEQSADYKPYTGAELEQMLAPIALYPDSVLTHILVASTYPIEVIQAERYVRENPNASQQQLIEQGEKMQWDPSVIALMPFADILKKMSEELTWTEQLGNAFLASEEQVLAAVQRLRKKALNAGTFDDMENMQISQEQQNIVIQPVQKEIVYVPYYDTRVVYGHWYWPDYPPVYWSHHARHYVHHYTPFYYYPAVHISDGWFIFGFSWNYHHVVVHNHHHHSYYYRHYHKSHHGKGHHNKHKSSSSHGKYAKGHNKHKSSSSHGNYAKGHNKHSSSQGNYAKSNGGYKGTSNGKGDYQRWQHNSKNRRGVAYQNQRVATKYGVKRPGKAELKNQLHVANGERYRGVSNNANATKNIATNNVKNGTNKGKRNPSKEYQQFYDKVRKDRATQQVRTKQSQRHKLDQQSKGLNSNRDHNTVYGKASGNKSTTYNNRLTNSHRQSGERQSDKARGGIRPPNTSNNYTNNKAKLNNKGSVYTSQQKRSIARNEHAAPKTGKSYSSKKSSSRSFKSSAPKRSAPKSSNKRR
ncbi:DUF3300 domain-containing protein [Thalassotalea sp. Y01]|uniref:DUF3300 domain-containing protein n=1 Tax=Thalassotalea sp. Y01 TaxID=2729613 RepID=UPI00145E4D72|nr:DUF3300 domain-containing protein [Thalassotalea sp. Y01]NMP17816.1 DUF3300 domain-containing protein [Thalassotalea sp. Y01]